MASDINIRMYRSNIKSNTPKHQSRKFKLCGYGLQPRLKVRKIYCLKFMLFYLADIARHPTIIKNLQNQK